jgi:mitogen-activated protein kinase kinase kinase
MTSSLRPRASSTRSNNNAEAPRPQVSPRRHPSTASELTLPEGLLLDVPTYNVSSSSNLLIPIYGTGSPYPSIPPSSPAARPRARSTAAADPLPSPLFNPGAPYRPANPSSQNIAMYQPSQRHPSVNDGPRQYVPPPPPMSPPTQPHMMSIPPPPPRPLIGQSHQHPGVMIPPPPGPPPGGMQSNWQGSWGRQYDARGFPLPPPNPPPNAQHQVYNPSQAYMNHQPPPLSIPLPPASDNQMSATYIPTHGDSFGPGVGIPGFASHQEPSFTRGDSAEYGVPPFSRYLNYARIFRASSRNFWFHQIVRSA